MSCIFLHGLESSGQGRKAQWIKSRVPELLTPDFTGSLTERMEQLEPWLAREPSWRIIGSSFGGLMAALWTRRHPEKVERLILLAPALHRTEYFPTAPPVDVPTLLVHGTEDDVVPLEPVAEAARRAFRHLTAWTYQDDHRLIPTSESMNWPALLTAGW